MIKIYKTNESNMIERVDEVIDNCWIDLVSPTKRRNRSCFIKNRY